MRVHHIDNAGVYTGNSRDVPATTALDPNWVICDDPPRGIAQFVGDGWVVLDSVPAVAEPVPAEVTMRQARLTLHAAGKLAAVNAAIAALPDPPKTAALIEWEYSSTVRRDSRFVALLGPALGLDAAALDDLFVAASKLAV